MDTNGASNHSEGRFQDGGIQQGRASRHHEGTETTGTSRNPGGGARKMTSHNAKYKLEHPDRVKAQHKKWRDAHPDYMKEYRKRYADQLKEYHRTFRLLNHQRIQEYWALRRKTHREQRLALQRASYQRNGREYARKYRLDHPETSRNAKRAYRASHPERVRDQLARRRRHLNPIELCLNRLFKGSHLHHMGEGIAIYIPSSLHNNIHHSLLNNENMDHVNWDALTWFAGEIDGGR